MQYAIYVDHGEGEAEQITRWMSRDEAEDTLAKFDEEAGGTLAGAYISPRDTEPVLSGPAIPDPAGSWYGRAMVEDFERRKPLCEICGEPLDAHATHGCP